LSIPSATCASDNVGLTGARVGDIAVATPDNTAGGSQTLTIAWMAWVSAPDVVTIRQCAASAAAQDPANQTWRVEVWRH
jgi:hypothetical protein